MRARRIAVITLWSAAFVAWCLFWYGLAAFLYWIFFVLK